ncbi:pentapeptide repeat-containing protein [Actinomadura namibiensis]|uniref:Uncharacterized protein YjbI with pentapeptide repeats n=1 Tax=Actinomadura namibiensis TaxID=182080 RepID=A0A7W3LRV7_ACTNM|nr:pentapeptide repeat-containing protein [Actinomadura namibiensis]MBA8953150.1 uncharacterized protein YjbI with pentapeptide repeats [Actinomadura namibiensis]
MPTQADLDRLPAQVRMELRNQQRAERHQWLNSLGILFGVLFTAGTLVFTGLAWRTAQKDLRTSQDNVRIARESQLTDRYAKALEPLADDNITIRLGAIHALNRLLADSQRDRAAITAVLAGFIRDRAPAPTTKGKGLPLDPSVDIAAALTTLANNPHPVPPLDLHRIRSPNIDLGNARFNQADLGGADLRGSYLGNAYLIEAYLGYADLRDTDLRSAHLTGAYLVNADLTGAYLRGARLSGANLSQARLGLDRGSGVSHFVRRSGGDTDRSLGTDLRSADLRGADLNNADLRGTDLRYANLRNANPSGADLRGADLRGADLTNAPLNNADLRGADLRGARFSVGVDEIRQVAVTDKTTRW